MPVKITGIIRDRHWRSKLSVSPKIIDTRLTSHKSVNGLRFSAEEKTEINNFDHAIKMNRWTMRVLGLWPLDTGFSNLFCIINVIILLMFILPATVQLHVLPKDWNSIINQLTSTVPFIILALRFIFIKIHTEKLRLILDSMIIDWKNYRYLPEQCRQMMNRYATYGRLFTIISIVFAILSIIGYTLTPVMNTWFNNLPWNQTNRYLPNRGYYPFPIKESSIFDLIYLTQAYTVFLSGMVMSAVDCFVCIIVFHACGQFDVLAAILQRYGCSFEHGCMRHTYSLVCACLSCIVKRHVHIMNYMDIVERSFNVFMLVQIFGNCFNFAIEGYLLYTFLQNHDINGIITSITYMITVSYNILIYCWIGESIIKKSDNIRIVAYNLEWHSFPSKYALPIILIIARSSRPCKITAGRFRVMSFSYYKLILSTLFSYIYLFVKLNK